MLQFDVLDDLFPSHTSVSRPGKLLILKDNRDKLLHLANGGATDQIRTVWK